jgi:hypothetical protein
MNPEIYGAAVSRPAPPIKTLLLAIMAPFAVITLMASPLLLDAVRQGLGI